MTAGKDSAENVADSTLHLEQETPRMTLDGIFKVVTASINKRYALMDTEELGKKLKVAESFTLVDCRMPKAYAESHIDGAINIPFTVFENSYHEIPKNKPVVLVCYLGMFSRVGAKLLVENGYQTVYSLVGGMKEWDKMHKI
jgi:rhodanese-related sulfurtransferase